MGYRPGAIAMMSRTSHRQRARPDRLEVEVVCDSIEGGPHSVAIVDEPAVLAMMQPRGRIASVVVSEVTRSAPEDL